MKNLKMWFVCVACLVTGFATVDDSPIIPPDAALETVSTGNYLFTEGPALAPDGSIYFSDIPNNSIHCYDPATGETTLFTNDSGGANGLMFDGEVLVQCQGKARRLFFVNPAPIHEIFSEKTYTLADTYEGVRLNSPNDLAVNTDGIYFTDPRYGKRDDMDMEIEAVYFVVVGPPEMRTITRVIDDLVRPNGIGVSPDGQTLYVNDHGDQKIYAYPILEPGKVGEARLLNDLADLGGPDGMTVGPDGNIYTSIYGQGIQIISPAGERLGFIPTGPETTNCCFGADGQTLYVTAEKSLKRILLNIDLP